MSWAKRHGHWIVAGCLLLAALICYAIGYSPGLAGFILLGVFLETLFWILVISPRRRRQQRLRDLENPD